MRIAPRSAVITGTSRGGAIFTTTARPSRSRIRYATLNQPCPSSSSQVSGSPVGTCSAP